MKNFTKYSLLLIFATCAWNSDVFGMIQFLKNAYHSVVPQNDPLSMAQKTLEAIDKSNINEATRILKTAGEKLNGEQFLQYLKTRFLLSSMNRQDIFISSFMEKVPHKIAHAEDAQLANKLFEFSNTLIKSALKCLNDAQLYAFLGGDDNSPLYDLAASHYHSKPENHEFIFAMEKNFIAAAVTALKAGRLTVDQFSVIIIDNNLERAIYFNDDKQVKILLISARTYLNDKQFNQIFIQDSETTANTILKRAIARDLDFKNGDKLCRLVLDAAMTLPDGDFELLLNAQNYRGETALDMARKADDEKIITLLENAKEKRAEKMKIMHAKNQIKNNKADIGLSQTKIERLVPEIRVKRKMLDDLINAKNNVIE